MEQNCIFGTNIQVVNNVHSVLVRMFSEKDFNSEVLPIYKLRMNLLVSNAIIISIVSVT